MNLAPFSGDIAACRYITVSTSNPASVNIDNSDDDGAGTVFGAAAAMAAILPILFPLASVNHRLPSRALTIELGLLIGVGTGYSCTVPSKATLPMLLALGSV